MDEKTVLKYARQTLGVEPINITPVDGGISKDLKYRVKTANDEYMLKIAPGADIRLKLYDELLKISNPHIASPTAFKLFDEEIICRASPWINGESLESVLEHSSESQVNDFGKQVANILIDLHRDSFQFPLLEGSLKRRVDFACWQVENLGVDFLGRERCCEFLRSETKDSAIKSFCLVHKDVRPENFMVLNNEIYLVDFESSGVGERAEDFNYLLTMGKYEHRDFSRVVVENYLAEVKDKDFWQKNLIYSTLSVVEYAVWKWQTKGRQVKHQAENLIREYDNLTSLIPHWFKRK